MWIPVIILAMFGLSGLLFYLSKVKEKERTQTFNAIADELGLRFYPDGDKKFHTQIRDAFSLFSIGRTELKSGGRSRKIANLLWGDMTEGEVAIFEYRFITGSGRYVHHYVQNVVYFRSTSMSLPQFAIQTKGPARLLGRAVEGEDLTFDTHKHFSKQYFVTGKNEVAIRELCSDALLSYYEGVLGVSTEVHGDAAIFYRLDKRINSDKVNTFLEEAMGAFELLKGA